MRLTREATNQRLALVEGAAGVLLAASKGVLGQLEGARYGVSHASADDLRSAALLMEHVLFGNNRQRAARAHWQRQREMMQ